MEQLTKTWWENTVADEDKLTKWLIKLMNTEARGNDDNLKALEQFTRNDSGKAARILRATAADELRHADMLGELLYARGVDYSTVVSPGSVYWNEMEKGIVDLATMAAVFHLGEELAAFRFKVIYNHELTPLDIRKFLDRALPDEQYHARSFRALTTNTALSSMTTLHTKVVNMITNPTFKMT